jgi:four helix bundle protein
MTLGAWGWGLGAGGWGKTMKSYRELQVWQFAIDLIEQVYRSTREFPRVEQYGLCSQSQRAAVSVASNIAEGHTRDSTKEFLHHISFAMGSLAELETHFVVAERLGYIPINRCNELLGSTERISKMLKGLQTALKKKIN